MQVVLVYHRPYSENDPYYCFLIGENESAYDAFCAFLKEKNYPDGGFFYKDCRILPTPQGFCQ